MCWIRFLFGACLGSFVHCLAYRLATSNHSKRSMCTACGHMLAWYELVPILSWLMGKGRCRHCHARIPIDVLLAELSTGIICMLGFPTVVWSILLFLNIHDLYDRTIPDLCHALLILIWGCTEWNNMRLGEGIGMMVFFGILAWGMHMYKGETCLGGGDIKLIGVCTLFLGVEGGWMMTMLASVIALVHMTIMQKRTIPFGPFLSLVFYVLYVI